ncbi:MAG: trigger factor [Oscillospiraceae bacterium]|nr:trigger factor [Oscillospiraceae bacterium]
MIVKNIEKKEDRTATFSVEVDALEFEAAVAKAYKKNKGSISIPGFRKGKAPRALIENMYGADMFYQDAMDELGPEAFMFGIENSGLKIIGRPSITDMDLSEEKVLTYEFKVELYPEVTLGQYRGLVAAKKAPEVTEEMVDAKLEELRKRNSRMVDVDRAAEMGDTANIDFDGYLDGVPFEGGKSEGYSLELGSGSFVPGFEEQVVGMQIGEEKDLDITFPENYTPELAGKAVVFKVKLNGLSVAELPEVDDEFIQDVSEFDTVEEYKADLREELAVEQQDMVDTQFRTDIMNMAIDNLVVDVPETMIMEKVDEMLRNYASQFGMNDREVSTDELLKLFGIDDETMQSSLRPSAVAQIKQELMFEAIAEAENIEVTDEELDEYINGAAQTVGAKPEDLINHFGLAYIKSEYVKEKASRIIIETASAE